MIYEVRMTVSFKFEEFNRPIKTTLIEYIIANGVGEAFNMAAEYKHNVIIKIAKGEVDLLDEKAWGKRSKNISISLDAVVAKPELWTLSKTISGKELWKPDKSQVLSIDESLNKQAKE